MRPRRIPHCKPDRWAVVVIRYLDPCVPAFKAVTQPSDTNGSGPVQCGLDTDLDRDTPHPYEFGQGGGPWGVAGACRSA